MASRNLLTGTQGKDWNVLAKQLQNRAGNPSVAAIAALVAETNTRVPFSQASSILDNGCGTGGVMSAILSSYGHDLSSSCTLICSDFSDGMIEQVNRTKEEQMAAGAKHWPRVQTIVSDAMHMSAVASGSLSHVLAGWVFFLTPDPRACLSECKRMLKTGGVLGLSSWEDSQWLQVMRELTTVFPDRAVPELPREWNSTEAVQHELEQAGFVDIRSIPLEVHLGYQSHLELVRFLSSTTPPMVAAMKGLSDAEMQRVHEAMVKKCRELSPEEPGQFSGIAIIAVGTRA